MALCYSLCYGSGGLLQRIETCGREPEILKPRLQVQIAITGIRNRDTCANMELAEIVFQVHGRNSRLNNAPGFHAIGA